MQILIGRDVVSMIKGALLTFLERNLIRCRSRPNMASIQWRHVSESCLVKEGLTVCVVIQNGGSSVSDSASLPQGELLSPCRCSGSVRCTHQPCLIKWISERGSWACELCYYKYQVIAISTKNPLQVRRMQNKSSAEMVSNPIYPVYSRLFEAGLTV